MIHDVDATLRRLLAAELARTAGCPVYDEDQITFDAPATAEAVQDGEAHVNLYLHDVRENVSMRDESYHLISDLKDNKAGRRRGMARLDLGYLITVYAGDDPATEHRLLSDVLGVLLRYQSAPVEYLVGLLGDKGPSGLLLAVAQPDHVANADPPALWQALGGRLRPALSLVATAPFDPFETKWTRAIREAVVGLGPGAEAGAPHRPRDTARRVSAAGIVIDQETEQPLGGTEVTVEGREEPATTDERGLFYLINLPPGTHTLRIHKLGYRVQQIRAVCLASGRPEQVEPHTVALRRLSDAEWAAEVAARAEVAANAPGLVEADRRYQVSLSGRLRFPDGRAAAFLPVRIGQQRTLTDADGIYFFMDLPSGDHTLIAEVPGRGDVPVETRDGSQVVTLAEDGPRPSS